MRVSMRKLTCFGALLAAALIAPGAAGEDLSISGASSPPITLKTLPSPPAAAGVPRQQVERQSGVAVSKEAAPVPAADPGQGMVLNFETAPIREVIKNICELLDMNYIIEQDVKGYVTIRTLKKIPISSALDLLDQLLTLNGLSRVKVGSYWRFMPTASAMKEPLQVYMNPPANDFVSRDRFIIQILSFDYVSASQALDVLKPFLSKEAATVILQNSNMLLLVERGTKLQEILSLVRAIDVDALDAMQVKLFELKNSGAGEVVAELNAIFSQMGYIKTPPAAGILLLPLDRLNAILMVNPFPNLYPTVKSWIEKLDSANVGSTEVTTNVYHVQHGDAESFANVLRQLYVEDPKKPKVPGQTAGTAMVEGPVLILSHPETNTIIIRTAERNYQIINETLKRLDRMPKQVLIEVLIAEIQLSDSLEFGLEWALKGNSGNTSVSMANNLGGLSGAASVATNLGNTGAFNPVGNAQGLSVFAYKSTDMMGLLHTLATRSQLDIKASPVLMTANNRPASIDITNELPISTITQTQTGATAQNIQYRSVGIRLSVTPKINEEQFVSLSVDQEISQIDDGRAAQFKALGITAMPLLRRQAKSNVVVRDQETLILGGMISEQKGSGRSGIPWLSDIPFLGWLFGVSSKTASKTELLILLTPHVISTEEEAQRLTEEYKRQIKDLQPASRISARAATPAPAGEKPLFK